MDDSRRRKYSLRISSTSSSDDDAETVSVTVESKRIKTATDDDNDDSDALDTSTAAPVTIGRLSTELLLLIVRRVDVRYWVQLELVNRQFRAVVLSAWRDLRLVRLERVFDFFSDKTTLGYEKFRNTLKLRRFLQTLFLRSPDLAELGGLSKFNRYLSPETVKDICRFRSLQRLELNENHDGKCLPVGLLRSGTNNWACLRHLNLSGYLASSSNRECRARSIDVKLALFRMTLRELIYRNNRFDQGACLARLNCDQLTLLDVAGSSIDSDVLRNLLARCTKLTHLDLSTTLLEHSGLCDNRLFDWLASSADRLVSLKINNFFRLHYLFCMKSSEENLRASRGFEPQHFGALTKLEINDALFCTDSMINAIIDWLGNTLKRLLLNVSVCREYSLLRLAVEMVNLEQLLFRPQADRCDNVSDNVVRAVAENLCKLTTLDLGHPSASATDALRSLTTLKNLRHLAVGGSFDDRTLVSVASELGPRLVSLRIPDSFGLSDQGVVSSASNLHKLLHLDLERAYVSDQALTSLARCCPELRTLNLSYCDKITRRGVRAVVDSCRKIKTLFLFRTGVKAEKLKGCRRDVEFSYEERPRCLLIRFG